MGISYQNTVKVFFTKDVNDIVAYIGANNFKKILILTGCFKTKDIALKLKGTFKTNEIKVLSGIETNANSQWIDSNILEARAFSPDVIITVGGGSVHDTGKALAIMIDSPLKYSIEDYTVNGKLSVPGIKKALPVITVPTISGSGAEVSPAALLRINNQKRVVFSPLLHPNATFINTDYFRSLSIRQISRSAFDSFIQAAEGLVSTAANNISNAFAAETIKYFDMVYSHLIKDDHESITEDVLEKIAVASIFSSYVCSTASVGAIHAISDPISGLYNVHHGTALAMVAPDVFKYNLNKVSKGVVEQFDSLLGSIETVYDDHMDSVLYKITRIINDLHLLDEIKDFSIAKEDIAKMASDAFNPDMAGNPYDFNIDEISAILRKYCND